MLRRRTIEHRHSLSSGLGNIDRDCPCSLVGLRHGSRRSRPSPSCHLPAPRGEPRMKAADTESGTSEGPAAAKPEARRLGGLLPPTPQQCIDRRRKAGLTQEELARAAGLSLGTIATFEQSRCRPRPRSLWRIAKALETIESSPPGESRPNRFRGRPLRPTKRESAASPSRRLEPERALAL